MGLVLYMPHLSKPYLFILLFCYGLSNVGVATCYAIACEMADTKVAATSMSFANMSSVIIGALFQPLIGFFLDHYASRHADKTFVYNASDYHIAMLALPFLFFSWAFGEFLVEGDFKNSTIKKTYYISCKHIGHKLTNQ